MSKDTDTGVPALEGLVHCQREDDRVRDWGAAVGRGEERRRRGGRREEEEEGEEEGEEEKEGEVRDLQLDHNCSTIV